MTATPLHPAVHLAAQLVRLATDGRDESSAVALVEPRLEQLGFTSRRCTLGNGRDSIVATYPGGPPSLALSGHLDTVPASRANWTRDPWCGVVEHGFLHGRGAADMKAGVAALVVALEQAAAGGADLSGVSVILTAGEETGCEGAARLAQEGHLPPAAALLVAEPTSVAPLLGHKGVVWTTLSARGKAAHGSTPERGINALVPVARAVAAIDGLDLEVTHPLLGRATVSPNRLVAGTAVNVVPDWAYAEVDVRTVPGLGRDQVMAALRAHSSTEIEVEPLQVLSPVASDPSTPLYAATSDRCAQLGIAQADPPAATFFTDASILGEALNAPTVICGPGNAAQAHGVDEWCAVEQIEQAVLLYTAILTDRVVG